MHLTTVISNLFFIYTSSLRYEYLQLSHFSTTFLFLIMYLTHFSFILCLLRYVELFLSFILFALPLFFCSSLYGLIYPCIVHTPSCPSISFLYHPDSIQSIYISPLSLRLHPNSLYHSSILQTPS